MKKAVVIILLLFVLVVYLSRLVGEAMAAVEKDDRSVFDVSK